MAQTITKTDDFDPTINVGVETFTFSWRDKTYEVDLGPDNADEYDKTFDELISVSRPVSVVASAAAKARKPRGTGSAAPDNEAAKIREWAGAQGIEVSARGRISQDLKDQYHAATGTALAVAE